MSVRYRLVCIVLWACIGVGIPERACGGGDGPTCDWPTYRYDARRSGFSPHALPGDLELHWRRQLPPYEVAFPHEPRKQFDASHQPVYASYKLFRGADADSIIDGSLAYSLLDGVFLIHDLAQSGVAEHGESPLQAVSHVLRWEARMTQRAPTGLSGDTRLLARAGDTFYGRAGTRLVALELTGGTPAAEVVWQVEVEARPTSVIAGGGRLFAVLEDGTLLGFGEGVGAEFEPAEPERSVIHATVPEELEADGDPPAGFVIALGGLSAEETEWFLQETPARLIVVSEDAEPHARERRRLALAGQYGRRVERFGGDPWEFRLPHYLASLLWCRGEVSTWTRVS